MYFGGPGGLGPLLAARTNKINARVRRHGRPSESRTHLNSLIRRVTIPLIHRSVLIEVNLTISIPLFLVNRIQVEGFCLLVLDPV